MISIIAVSGLTSQAVDGLSVIVPVYNEESTIESVLDELVEVLAGIGYSHEIIVVNDGSTDGSSALLQNHHDGVRVLEHTSNRGYGAALKSGIRNARYALILIMDADGTYPHEAIPQLLQRIVDNDMVVGARIGPNVEIPRLRRLAKWFLRKLANYLSGASIPDLNSGLRIIKKDLLERYFHLLPNGFSFTTTITLALTAEGYQVEYIAINYGKRKGRSKIRPIRDTFYFLQLIIRMILYFNPLKVFLPLSLTLMGLSFALLLYRAFVQNVFEVTIVVLFLAGVQLLALGMIADLIVARNNWRSFE